MNEKDYTPILKRKYEREVVPSLMDKFRFKNRLQVPHLEKIVINMGVGEALQDEKVLQEAMECLALITGQKPVMTKAKKSIAGFKVREGKPIGCKVTLRRNRMYEFLERLIDFALPQVRDFRGVSSKSFDGRGNYTMGINELRIFPGIDYDKVKHEFGMDICMVTTSKEDKHTYELLKILGMPFRDNSTS